jgi:hypothetical protein
MFARRCEPIWYALAQAPVLSETQWRSAVEHAYTNTDRDLLRLLFERPDRLETDRQWLLDTAWPWLFDQVLTSAVTTVEHARRALTRRDEPREYRSSMDNSETAAVAEGLSWNPRLGEDAQLQEFAIDVIGQLSPEDTIGIILGWPGHHPPEALLWALLDRAVHLPAPRRNSWEPLPDEPVGGQWTHLWNLLRSLPATLQAETAGRWPRLQAVLLEHGDDLDPMVLDACTPVLTDPNLGGPGPLSVAGRLATLRRWIERHPGVAGPAGAASMVAARDAVRALADHEQWDDLVDELLVFTSDPAILADAVRQIAACIEPPAMLRTFQATPEARQEADTVQRRARVALVSLARSPHTPDDVLLAVLPSAPSYTAEDLLEIRPHLREELTAEILARTGTYEVKQVEPLVQVATDDELAATGNPAGVLTSYLLHLPDASPAQASRLATRLLRSRYTDATVLAALPADVVLNSAWHADLAARMLAEACDDDPDRWALTGKISGRGLTFAGYLAQLREYTPVPPGTGLAGYRYCHACQLISPHHWPDADKSQRPAHERDGWMNCALCRGTVPPTRLLPADAAEPCPECATLIDYPAGAAVLECPACRRRYVAPDLPDDLRPRLDGVLAEQNRIAGAVGAFLTRTDAYLAEQDIRPADDVGSGGARLMLLDPTDVPGEVRHQRPARRFPVVFELTAPPADWLSDDAPAGQFRTALRTAIRRHDKDKQREAALQRYGLGRTRRPVAVADIARTAGVTTGAVTRWIRDCVGSVYANAVMPLHPRMTAGDRASHIVAHLADQALGNLDITDPATGRRIAALLTAALPGVDPDAGVRLLLRLTGWYHELDQVRISGLIWNVTHASRP